MVKKILIAIAFIFAVAPFAFSSISAFASPCSELNAKEVLRLPQDANVALVACAEDSRAAVSDLTVLRIQGDAVEHVFEGDPASKSYRLQKKAPWILIQEALSTRNSKPFLETKISCPGGKCQAAERCIWKKAKSNTALVQKVQAELKRHSPVRDIEIEQLFYAALNGSAEAKKIFESADSGLDAGASEAFETYKADLEKMAKLHCL